MVMEMDSLEVVNLWSPRRDDRSIVAPILDVVGELVSEFISFLFSMLGVRQIILRILARG
jgi:hypothetical protein